MLYRFVLLVFLILLLAPGSWGQSSATGAAINGTIRDAAGAAVANATITLRDLSTGRSLGLTTDAEGVFRAPSVPVGTYEVQVAAPGFQTVTSRVDLVLGR